MLKTLQNHYKSKKATRLQHNKNVIEYLFGAFLHRNEAIISFIYFYYKYLALSPKLHALRLEHK